MQHLDVVSNMVNNVRMLRLSVTELFATLADNGPEPQTQPPKYQQEKQAQHDLIQFVTTSINKIYTILRTLDEGVDHLTGPSLSLSLAETTHLGYDAVSGRDSNLYIELCRAFKTYDSIHEYGMHCNALVNQQSLKRSHHPLLATTQRVDKSQRRALYNPYSQIALSRMSSNGQTSIDIADLINACIKPYPMEAVYSRPFGISTGVVQLSLNKTLKAILILRGKLPDAMIVKAYHESFASGGAHKHVTKSGATTKASTAVNQALALPSSQSSSDFVDPDNEVDIWSESKYIVFRKITQQANIAMLHFQYPTYPDIALKSFFAWLASYSNLFQASCTKCNCRLRNFLPPTCREYRSGFEPHHESCR